MSLIGTVGNLNLLEATDAAVNDAVNGLSGFAGSSTEVSANELRDMAHDQQAGTAPCWSSRGTS